MSVVQFYEHNCERFELVPSAITSELRCDLCGEFAKPENLVQVFGGMVSARGVNLGTYNFDAHPDHLLTWYIPDHIRQALAVMVTPPAEGQPGDQM